MRSENTVQCAMLTRHVYIYIYDFVFTFSHEPTILELALDFDAQFRNVMSVVKSHLVATAAAIVVLAKIGCSHLVPRATFSHYSGQGAKAT